METLNSANLMKFLPLAAVEPNLSNFTDVKKDFGAGRMDLHGEMQRLLHSFCLHFEGFLGVHCGEVSTSLSLSRFAERA